MKTQEVKEKFVELRARDWSFAKIAEELEVSKPTLIEWARELDQEISNLKAIELETLQEKYYLQKAQKIELYGEQLKKIKAALDERIEKRDLKDLKTGELFKLFLEYMDRLEAERVPTKFVVQEKNNMLEPMDFEQEVFVEFEAS